MPSYPLVMLMDCLSVTQPWLLMRYSALLGICPLRLEGCLLLVWLLENHVEGPQTYTSVLSSTRAAYGGGLRSRSKLHPPHSRAKQFYNLICAH
jgi:hypothetical protein